jgi:hypothetical protein
MLSPDFPYKNNQIILSSDRITLNSKTDGIFLFGKKMVAIASNETVNIDAKEKILLDCDKIELGHKAEQLGEPLILGYKMVTQLNALLESLQYLAAKLSSVSKTGDAASWIAINDGGHDLHEACERFILVLNNANDINYPLSSITYTR